MITDSAAIERGVPALLLVGEVSSRWCCEGGLLIAQEERLEVSQELNSVKSS